MCCSNGEYTQRTKNGFRQHCLVVIRFSENVTISVKFVNHTELAEVIELGNGGSDRMGLAFHQYTFWFKNMAARNRTGSCTLYRTSAPGIVSTSAVSFAGPYNFIEAILAKGAPRQYSIPLPAGSVDIPLAICFATIPEKY